MLSRLKNIIIDFYYEYRWVLLIMSGIVSILFSSYFICRVYFNISNDQILLYNNFIIDWVRVVRDAFSSGSLPLYSWNSFLGSDIIGSSVYLGVGDIFLPIYLLFDSISVSTLVVTILLYFISAISMGCFLYQFGIEKRSVRNFISIIYAISGWALLFTSHYMFHRFYAFFPLIFFGFEYYLNHRKCLFFILSIALGFITCSYFMFPTSIFIFIYGLFTTYNRGYKFVDIIVLGFKFIGFYLLGVGLSSVFLFPFLYNLYTNNRIGVVYDRYPFWELKCYAGFIINLISSPYPINLGELNLFHFRYSGHESWYSLCISIIPVISGFSILFKREFKAFSITFLVLLLLLFSRDGGYLMHGFSEQSLRWTFIFLFFLLLMGAKGLDIYDIKRINFSMFVYVFLFLSAILYVLSINNINTGFNQHYLSILFSAIVSLVIYFVFVKYNYIGYALSIIYLVFNMYYLFDLYNDKYYFYFENVDVSKIESIYDTDDDFFRFYVDNSMLHYNSTMNLNGSLYYDYMGVSTFNSTYDSTINEFIKLNNISGNIIDLKDINIMNMLGVKYYMLGDIEFIKDINYKYISDNQELYIYENLDYKGFGYTGVNYDYIDNYDSYLLDDTIFIDDLSYDLSSLVSNDQQFNIKYNSSDKLYGDISSNGKSILMIPIPNNVGWQVKVNGVDSYTISVNGGFMGIELIDGYNDIKMLFRPFGFNMSVLLTCISMIIIIYISYIQYKKDKLIV